MPQLNKRSVKVGPGRIACRARLETLNVEKRTIDFVFSTGARVKRFDWWEGKVYYEELEVSEETMDLEFFRSGAAPFLIDHSSYRVDNTVGVIEGVKLEPDDGRQVGVITVRFAKDEVSDRHFQRVIDGVTVNCSVGYNPGTYRDVTTPDDKHQVLRAIKWEPLETSLVAIPADRGQRSEAEGRPDTRVEIQIIEKEFVQPNLKPSERNQNMPPNENTLTPEQLEAKRQEEAKTRAEAEEKARKAEAEAKAKGAEEERARQEEIRAAGKASGLDVEDMVKRGISAAEARKEILAEMGRKQTQINGKTDASVTLDEADVRSEAITNSILHRMSPSQHKLEGKAREFAGLTFMDLARMELERKGTRVFGMGRSEIASRALHTTDLPKLLVNGARRRLAAEYEIAAQTFRPFVSQGTLPDYREAQIINFGADLSLKTVPEGGEYEMATLTEGSEKTKLVKRGRLLLISEEMIVNDDLRALDRVPRMFSHAAARAESDLIYNGNLIANPAMADGVVLFHADHGNLQTAAAITEASVALMESALMEQKDSSKNFLNLVPKFLVVGTANKLAAQKLLANITAGKSGDVNPYQGAMTLIVDPRVTGKKWFMITDPNACPTIELNYLEGENGPTLSEIPEQKTDGVAFKMKHVFAAKAADFRGMQYNPGA